MDEVARPKGTDPGAKGGGQPAALSPVEALDTVPLGAHHLTANFCCQRSERVQQFVRKYAREYVKQSSARVFVYPNPDSPNEIWGIYTLSASSVHRQLLEKKHQNKLPAGIPAPVVLLGYMGRHDGAPKGLDAGLMWDAARRVSRIDDVGIWGLVLHAETPAVAQWYETLGFLRAPEIKPGDPLTMYAPLSWFKA